MNFFYLFILYNSSLKVMYNSKRIIKYTNYYDIVFFYQNNPVLKEIVCDKLITTLKTNF